MGGPQCHMSILRNDNVACPCRLFSPMTHVEKAMSHVSITFTPLPHVARSYVACRISDRVTLSISAVKGHILLQC